MWIEIETGQGGIITAQPFDVTLQGAGYAEQPWSYILNSSIVSSLSAGGYTLSALIDPFNDPNFLQETTTNDRSSALLTLLEIPDVFVDPKARPSSPQVNSGEKVTWQVTVTNTGGLQVSGKIEYTFEGVTELSGLITLNPSESYTWSEELSTAVGAHIAPFEANWIASQGSWDSDLSNNQAISNISVEANLRLNWATSSLSVTDQSGNDVKFPIEEGETYVFSINLTSQELGDLSFDCRNGENQILSTTEVNVSSTGQKVSLQCEFIAIAPLSTIQLIPSDTSVTTTFTRQFSTTFTSTDDSSAQSKSGTVTLIAIVVVVLIAILALAIWFTRETEEEVERDIFEYCPACDGELEGDESRCPHCSFNLKKARKQFHECHECGESVPDLMDNCPYCGAKQDVSSFFERRERKVRTAPKVEIALPEEDDDKIVSGTENFAEAVREFGYDEDQLEGEWDEEFAKAEAEIAELEQLYEEEEISTEDMTPEEIEELESRVTTKLRSLKQLGEDSSSIDDMLAAKGDLISHKDDGGELSASDADIRGRLYEITGEEGIMPGDEVHVGMNLSDGALAGNEIEEAQSDFTFEDDEPIAKLETQDELTPQRQKPKRREKKTAECGACGAEIPIMAKECPVCGAEFE
jgi:hypothetical protein